MAEAPHDNPHPHPHPAPIPLEYRGRPLLLDKLPLERPAESFGRWVLNVILAFILACVVVVVLAVILGSILFGLW